MLTFVKQDRYLNQIFELFIKPYVKVMHPRTNHSVLSLVEAFFHIETRHIVNVAATSQFLMPGGRKVHEDRTVFGTTKPKIPAGTLLTVRMDKIKPNAIDVFWEDSEGQEHEYVLTQLQFQSIMGKLANFPQKRG
jgi:hypothetical protein